MNTNEVGARAEGAVLGALLQARYAVLVPFGTLRYDLAIDGPEGIKRVQCKSGRLLEDKGVIEFAACSSWPDGRRRTDYRDQADYFGVYCHTTGDCYLVPVEEVGRAQVYLRLTPPRNGQKRGIRLAEEFLIKRSQHDGSCS